MAAAVGYKPPLKFSIFRVSVGKYGEVLLPSAVSLVRSRTNFIFEDTEAFSHVIRYSINVVVSTGSNYKFDC